MQKAFASIPHLSWKWGRVETCFLRPGPGPDGETSKLEVLFQVFFLFLT